MLIMRKGDKELTNPASYDSEVAQAIVVLAHSVSEVAKQLQMLGNGACDSQGWGAIESLGKSVSDGMDKVADAISSQSSNG